MAAEQAPNRTATGILWMLLTTFMFVCVTGIVRHVGSDIPAVEAAFIRYAIGLVLILPAARALFRAPPSRGDWGLYCVRGVLHGGGVMLWFYAMARIPIAELVSAKVGTEEQLLGPGMVASVFQDVREKLPVTWKSFTPSLGLELTFGHPLADTVHMGVWGVLWAEVLHR